MLLTNHSFLEARVVFGLTHLNSRRELALLLMNHCGTVLTLALVIHHATAVRVAPLTLQLVALSIKSRFANDLLPWSLHV